jgi:hypothetical protein
VIRKIEKEKASPLEAEQEYVPQIGNLRKRNKYQLVVRENLRMDSKQQKQTKMVCIRLTYRSRATKKR